MFTPHDYQLPILSAMEQTFSNDLVEVNSIRQIGKTSLLIHMLSTNRNFYGNDGIFTKTQAMKEQISFRQIGKTSLLTHMLSADKNLYRNIGIFTKTQAMKEQIFFKLKEALAHYPITIGYVSKSYIEFGDTRFSFYSGNCLPQVKGNEFTHAIFDDAEFISRGILEYMLTQNVPILTICGREEVLPKLTDKEVKSFRFGVNTLPQIYKERKEEFRKIIGEKIELEYFDE